MKLPKQIIDIAKDARERCERYAESRRSETKHYHEQEDLRCMCATASAVLYEMLKTNGIKSQYCNGHYHTGEKDEDMDSINHCWLEVDGKILDITATQFGKTEEVYIVDDEAKKYNKKNDVEVWQEMTWQWKQKPTPAIVTEIIGVDIQESITEAKKLLNEALEQSAFYAEDVHLIVQDTDTEEFYDGLHTVYHGENQIAIHNHDGTVIGWTAYKPPSIPGSMLLRISFTKDIARADKVN